MTVELKTTPLDALHRKLGARMVPFAGYSMPVQYAAGVMKEHQHTRAAAGLFDVSHMGQVALHPRSRDVADAARALERLVPVDVVGLAEGRQRYAFFTNKAGGILDDLMVANRGDHLFLVVNASRKDEDVEHMQMALGDAVEIERFDRGLVALQGPRAEEALASVAPAVRDMRFMDVREVEVAGTRCLVSRSGYTGEDGFEISIPLARAVPVTEALLAHEAVMPVGLGARDSLRLEAGLCLYGNDIDETTTPVEAALTWAIQKVRRRGGEREGGFPGADTILAQQEEGAPRRRVGLKAEGRAPVRSGATLHLDSEDEAVGTVTSGVFGPTVDGPVAMGYVPAAYAEPGTRLFAEVRGKRLPVTVAALPFTRPGFKR